MKTINISDELHSQLKGIATNKNTKLATLIQDVLQDFADGIQYAEIYELYSLIPLEREIADRFISNCLNEKIHGAFKSNDEIRLSIKKNGFKDTLFGAFDWVLSPENGEYWRNIIQKLQK